MVSSYFKHFASLNAFKTHFLSLFAVTFQLFTWCLEVPAMPTQVKKKIKLCSWVSSIHVRTQKNKPFTFRSLSSYITEGLVHQRKVLVETFYCNFGRAYFCVTFQPLRHHYIEASSQLACHTEWSDSLKIDRKSNSITVCPDIDSYWSSFQSIVESVMEPYCLFDTCKLLL